MTIDKLSVTPPSTIRSDEVARFNRLAATWWNRTGPMRPLHVVNELRLGHVLEQIARRFGRPVGALQGLRIADIGCGAGLMCEPLSARGAVVVGVDAAANNIAAARLHSKAAGLHIDYRVGEPDAALHDGESFNVLLLLEVVEHVDNVPAFVRDAVAYLAPGGAAAGLDHQPHTAQLPGRDRRRRDGVSGAATGHAPLGAVRAARRAGAGRRSLRAGPWRAPWHGLPARCASRLVDARPFGQLHRQLRQAQQHDAMNRHLPGALPRHLF